jgi:ketosteroid isomerase-like protein
MRPLTRLALLIPAAVAVACGHGGDSLSDADRRAVADTLVKLIRHAYDLSAPNVAERLLSLYPDTGRIVSASGGQVVTSRDTLAQGIRYFWESTGRNMQQPRWIWEHMIVDVLAPDAGVVTATYRIPHRTPRGEPHEIAGAMTLVFARRGGRWVVVQEHLSDRATTEVSMAAPAGPPDTTTHRH